MPGEQCPSVTTIVKPAIHMTILEMIAHNGYAGIQKNIRYEKEYFAEGRIGEEGIYVE
jgi:hypothetical protein